MINTMISLLIVALVLLCITCSVTECSRQSDVGNTLQSLGFSPKCVSKALYECSQHTSLEEIVHYQKKLNQLIQEVRDQDANCYSKRYLNCASIKNNISGTYTIVPDGKPVEVYCEFRNSEGWTVIQQRMNVPVRENFVRKWADYISGFGNITQEHWIGLDTIHALTKNEPMSLRVELVHWAGIVVHADYSNFKIHGANSFYKIHVSGYTGSAGDDMSMYNGANFSTIDKDYDSYEGSCANRKGGWWYTGCNDVNINGLPHEEAHNSNADGINWKPWTGPDYSLMETRMMVRPSAFN